MKADRKVIHRDHERAETWDEGRMVDWCSGCGQRPWPCDTALANERIVRLEEQRDRLRAALEPFQFAIDVWTNSAFGDETTLKDGLTLGDWRRLGAALTDDPLPLGPVKYPAKPGAANVSLVDDDPEGET